MFHRVVTGLLDLLAPPRCAACDALLDARASGFCGACGPLLESAHEAVPDGVHEARDHAACVYGGPLRDALHRLKYQGASDRAAALSRLLDPPARAFCAPLDCVAIVPLHPRRLRERGYNQCTLLARPLARRLGLPFLPRLLKRVRETSAQVGKRRVERTRALQGALVATPSARGRTVLVIDDVRTTGATLAEARRALLAAGASDVFTLALAIAPRGDENDDLGGL